MYLKKLHYLYKYVSRVHRYVNSFAVFGLDYKNFVDDDIPL